MNPCCSGHGSPTNIVLKDAARRSFLETLIVKGAIPGSIFHDASGRPVLRDGRNISFSYSFERAVCAVTGSEVGCDVEYVRSFDVSKATFLSEPEKMFCLESENPARTATTFWCRKESLGKCLGTGIVCNPSDMYVGLPNSIDEIRYRSRNYSFSDCGIEADYCYTVCSSGTDVRVYVDVLSIL